MSEEVPRSSKAILVSAIVVILLAAGYFAAWTYTATFAGLTASRTSPAPFVIVERESVSVLGLQGKTLVSLPGHSTRVLLWCGNAEIEVTSHMQFR